MSMLWLSVVDGQIHVPVATQFLLLVKKVSHLQRTFLCVATQFWESENGTLFLHACATCVLMSIYLGVGDISYLSYVIKSELLESLRHKPRLAQPTFGTIYLSI